MPKFVSRYAAHRIVVRPAKQIRDESGRVVDVDHGRVIQFDNHVYETEDPEEIEVLRKHIPGDIASISDLPVEVVRKPVEIAYEGQDTRSISVNQLDYRCKLCGRAFPSAQGLAIHIGRAHPEVESELEEASVDNRGEK